MMTLYLWDKRRLYAGYVDVDLDDSLPLRSTPTAPPELVGDQVARWTVRGWEVLDEAPATPMPVPSSDAVDAERDRRINEGFDFQGVRYQSRLPQDGKSGDWEVFSGKVLEALMAVLREVQPGDLRWENAEEDFAWIAADNTRVPMDAQTVIALGKAASAHRTKHTFAGSDLKKLEPIPADYTDDRYWP